MKKIAYPLLAISTFTMMSVASAEDAFDLHGSTMTGDWNGTRTEWAEKGIKFDGTIAMDNHIVVGVGNIYATESLFNLGIHPAQPASNLSKLQVQNLVIEIKRILKQAIDLGGSTLRDYSNAMGENGYFQQTLLAYGRAGEMCINCETTLENLKLGQRASVFCPQCQPLKRIKDTPKKIRGKMK